MNFVDDAGGCICFFITICLVCQVHLHSESRVVVLLLENEMLFTGSYYVTLERRFIVEIDLIQVRLMVMCQIDTTADNL